MAVMNNYFLFVPLFFKSVPEIPAFKFQILFDKKKVPLHYPGEVCNFTLDIRIYILYYKEVNEIQRHSN